MQRTKSQTYLALLWLVLATSTCGIATAQTRLPPVHPEETQLSVRPPWELPHAQLPATQSPLSDGSGGASDETVSLSLDQAIRIALENSEVIRVLVGGTATSTGATAFDPAIASTQVDRERARFDVKAKISNAVTQLESPLGVYDLTTSDLASIAGTKVQRYDLRAELSKKSIVGGTWSSNVNVGNSQYASPFTSLPPLPPLPVPLNPDVRTSVDIGYRQPLLQGAGPRANTAPIRVAQIATEVSYYELKNNLQGLVRSGIEAYWSLASAQVMVQVRQRQLEDGQFAFERAKARLDRGQGTAGDVAQTRAALARFRVALIEAEGERAQRELLLRNVLGIPPGDGGRLVPATPMSTEPIELDWELLTATAEAQRPDIAQRKLAVEKIEQQLVVARNLARPSVDFVGLYRVNGLSGTTPSGRAISTGSGQYTDWSMGIVYEGALGQRESRAELRRQELTLARERANLQQSVHSALHQLAESQRRLRQFYESYLASQEATQAARQNLEQQSAEFQRGRTIYLNVLQAIQGWGDAVGAEAIALASYNAELARLDTAAGTILEAHGIDLIGHNYYSRGPLAPLHDGRSYPNSARPTVNTNRYPSGESPVDQVFDLDGVSGSQPAPLP